MTAFGSVAVMSASMRYLIPLNAVDDVLLICSHGQMEQVSHTRIADILLSAPGWARVGLTMPDERIRVSAAEMLAVTILERLAEQPVEDARQLHLPMEGM